MKRLTAILLILLTGLSARAQFKKEAFSQNYADSSETMPADSSALFNFKEFAAGLTHQRSASLKTMFMGSTVMLGAQQIYNRQTWKLPMIYVGFGASLGTGLYYRARYKESVDYYEAVHAIDPKTAVTVDESLRTKRNIALGTAGLIYWATLMDGVINYPGQPRPDPAKATFYSMLLPGLGQIYNGEYWKVPIYWGLIGGSIKYYFDNRRNYERYRSIYREATSEDPTVEPPPISADNALYYRDIFRRYRDYSVLATAVFYVLQIIDANVFAYMQDFELSDDIALHVTPAVVTPDYAFTPTMGFSIGLTF